MAGPETVTASGPVLLHLLYLIFQHTLENKGKLRQLVDELKVHGQINTCKILRFLGNHIEVIAVKLYAIAFRCLS